MIRTRYLFVFFLFVLLLVIIFGGLFGRMLANAADVRLNIIFLSDDSSKFFDTASTSQLDPLTVRLIDQTGAELTVPLANRWLWQYF